MESLIACLKENGQEHILASLGNDFDENHPVYGQLNGMNIPDILSHFKIAKEGSNSNRFDVQPLDDKNVVFGSTLPEDEKDEIAEIGWSTIMKGEVCSVIMSGGQGTRLGYEGPKGIYDFGLPSKKSIFQLHFEKIMKVKQLAQRKLSQQGGDEDGKELPDLSIMVYIMTSDINDTQIREFFATNNYFNYPKEDIYFFQQGLEPCIDFDGKMILDSKTSLSMAPDGNGGIYKAMRDTGAVESMVNKGIKHLHIYGIDNVLTKSLDPFFIGTCVSRDVEVGNKVVWRASTTEKVGVATQRKGEEGCMTILEYSEIPSQLADAMDENGKLVYGAGNICNHYISLQFLQEKVLEDLMAVYHLAPKKIPYYDPEQDTSVAPDSNNGVKLELFVFDVFPLASKFVCVEVPREDEFAPVKNAPGSATDTPEVARRMMSDQYKRWLGKVNATITCSDEDLIEISPLLSYDGEGLEQYANENISTSLYLQ